MYFGCLCINWVSPIYLHRRYHISELPIILRCKECHCNVEVSVMDNGGFQVKKVEIDAY